MRKRYTVVVGIAMVLTAHVAQAQNSYNIWTAAPPAPITPLAKKQRPAPKAVPDPVAPAVAPTAPQAAAPAAPPVISTPIVKQSKLLKRGLTIRMRENRPLSEDSVSMVFFAQNSEYPPVAIKAGAQGRVVIKLKIAPNGEVSSTSVVAMEPRAMPGWSSQVPASAMQALASEAQRVFQMLRFEPAAKASEEELMANFSLQ
jgi:outer membrane biosynthesis protein TonB